MDWLVVAFVAAQAVLIAIVAGIALARGRTLEAIAVRLDGSRRPADEAAPGSKALAEAIAHLQRQAEVAEFALEQRLRDLAYPADLIGVGIVRLDTSSTATAVAAGATFILRLPVPEPALPRGAA